ncbi:radical SAM/SPASM domain-containing protein [Streptomyces spectabilis]|uniref:radical SAM/SPASM domain-containing protein n=1 Tax=Streptomyces spectabilis TaxID=68270 RepID=UPI0033FB5F23
MTTIAAKQDGTPAAESLWLDVTRKCQLNCVHCYNSSGPDGGHGAMTRNDWFSVLDQSAKLGVSDVTLIGGEPTMYPHAIEIAEHALTLDMEVEVYSNLVHVSERWWTVLQREGMSIATSYYSEKPERHNQVTRRPSHARTRDNIAKAISLGIPIRAGIVGNKKRHIWTAKRDLRKMGVEEIGVDRIREFGRACGGQEPDASNLCGMCGDGRASIGPNGEVSPCVFSTWIGVGNVQNASLASILSGPALSWAVASIEGARRGRSKAKACRPDCVPQNPCDPRCEPNVSAAPENGDTDGVSNLTQFEPFV